MGGWCKGDWGAAPWAGCKGKACGKDSKGPVGMGKGLDGWRNPSGWDAGWWGSDSWDIDAWGADTWKGCKGKGKGEENGIARGVESGQGMIMDSSANPSRHQAIVVPGRCMGDQSMQQGIVVPGKGMGDPNMQQGIVVPAKGMCMGMGNFNGFAMAGKAKGKGKRDPDQTVWVGNLPYTAQAEAVKEFFGNFGNVVDVDMKYDHNTGEFRGFAFVSFEDKITVDSLCAMTSMEFEGRPVDMRPAGGGLGARKAESGKDKGVGKGKKGDGKDKGKDKSASEDRIFVGGLPPTATQSSVMTHFQQYGVVKSVDLKFGQDGLFRGFGFITFDSKQTADFVRLNAASTQFEGAMIVCKATLQSDGGDGPAPERLFLGGLPKSTTPAMVHEHFAQFGEIVNVDLKYDQQGSFRCFGFVTMANKEGADKVSELPHVIEGRTIDVKRAVEHDGTFKVDSGFKGKGKGGEAVGALGGAISHMDLLAALGGCSGVGAFGGAGGVNLLGALGGGACGAMGGASFAQQLQLQQLQQLQQLHQQAAAQLPQAAPTGFDPAVLALLGMSGLLPVQQAQAAPAPMVVQPQAAPHGFDAATLAALGFNTAPAALAPSAEPGPLDRWIAMIGGGNGGGAQPPAMFQLQAGTQVAASQMTLDARFAPY